MMGKRKIVARMQDFFIMIAVMLGTTFLGMLFVKMGFPETNIVVIYIFAVLMISRFTKGYFYGILSSIGGLLCFNYFFTAPYHTLSVNDPSYMITFSIMLITALITSALTTKEKMMTIEATQKGAESQILYMLSNRLSDASDIEAIVGVTAESLSKLLGVNVGCIYVGRQSDPVFIQQLAGEQIHRRIEDIDEMRRKYEDLRMEYVREEGNWVFPINGQTELLAVVMIDAELPEEQLIPKKKMLHSMIENISLGLERVEVTIERIKDRQKMEQEQERANMLRAISHDLRTPLSGIMGSAEMLMDMTEREDKRQSLIKGIYKEADWLKSLVENILSLTRLQDGRVVVHKEPEALEEIVASSVAHIEKNYPDREIDVRIPDEFQMVPMDARLVEQVITNLLDNAVKHTKAEEKISVTIEYPEGIAKVTVQDEGEGIVKEDEGNLFQLFYTSKIRSGDVRKGIGIGLTICETVVKAHGGTIEGRNRRDKKGAEFIFTLPLSEEEQR